MTITLVGPTNKQIFRLENEMLVKIQNGNWELYTSLANEDLKVEYIKDAVFIQSPASLEHEEIFLTIIMKIKSFIANEEKGKVVGSRFPIKLVDGRRAEPDILYMSKKAIDDGKLTNTLFEGKPTWIIEIISPTYRDHDTVTKREEYRELDVEEFWIIDPEYKTIEIINFKEKKEIRKEIVTGGKLKPRQESLEGFEITVEEIFLRK
jgi:Uma2 family endonuclease